LKEGIRLPNTRDTPIPSKHLPALSEGDNNIITQKNAVKQNLQKQ